MKVFKYIFKQKLLITLTILLLIVESLCTFITPYISSLVIDYGIHQNGVMIGVPLELDPYSYRATLRMLDGSDKRVMEYSYSPVARDAEDGSNSSDNTVYEITLLGALNADRLGDAVMPVFAFAAQLPNSYEEVTYFGVENEEQISPDKLDQYKAAIFEYSQTHDKSEIYHNAVLEKLISIQALGIDRQAMQLKFITWITLLMLIIVATYLLVTIIGTYFASKISFTISRDLRKKQFKKVMSFSNHDMDKFSRASLITRATNDLQVIQNTSVFILRSILIAPLMLIVGFVMATLTAPSLLWIVAAAIAFMIVMAIILLSIVTPRYKMVQKLIDKINSIARESISGVPIIRALNNEDFQEERFTKVNEKLYKTMLFAISILIIAMPLLMLTVNIVSVAILWAGSFQLQAGYVNIGQLIAFISYATETIFAFLSIAAGFVILPRADVSMGRIEEVLKHELKIKNFDTKTKTANMKNGKKEYIKFENVGFKYESSKKYLFKNLNIDIKKNSLNAIVGPTGSGKSALLKLLLRYYDVNSGKICIDGVDVKNFNEKDLRKKLSYVPQKVFLFEGSIKENAALNPDVKDEKLIEECIRFVNLGKFLDSNEEGMDYKLSQGAINLSGGQKQRLTIARAISEKLPILLMDDPFSALDANTEKLINTGLKSKFKDVTILLVTQRLSSVVDYDNIIFIDDGKVVGTGTHKQLLKNKKYKAAFEKAKSPTIREVK